MSAININLCLIWTYNISPPNGVLEKKNIGKCLYLLNIYLFVVVYSIGGCIDNIVR